MPLTIVPHSFSTSELLYIELKNIPTRSPNSYIYAESSLLRTMSKFCLSFPIVACNFFDKAFTFLPTPPLLVCDVIQLVISLVALLLPSVFIVNGNKLPIMILLLCGTSSSSPLAFAILKKYGCAPIGAAPSNMVVTSIISKNPVSLLTIS